MNNKTNPWMIATFALSGLIIGYFFGKSGFSVESKNIAATATQQNIATAPEAPKKDTYIPPAAPTTPPVLKTALEINYDNIEKTLGKDKHWSIGSKKAKVKIEEFSDFQCPFCHRFFAETMPQIVNDYVKTGKALYTYYNFPLDFHQQAAKAAEAAHCAGDQNRYWEMHDLLFQNQQNWQGQPETYLQTFTALAESLKLKSDNFKSCLESGKYTKVVQDDLNLGKQKEISGTPTVFINGAKIVGAQPYSDFQQAIEKALK